MTILPSKRGVIDDLLDTVPDGNVLDVRIGLHWTAVVAEIDGEQRCGLATTLRRPAGHTGKPDVMDAGHLEALSGLAMANLLRSENPRLRSVGGAAINALLPHPSDQLVTRNAEEAIAAHGQGKVVVIVGRFPFASRLSHRVAQVQVLERNPLPGELPESAAPDVIPGADVVAITGMALLNHTLEDLLELCSPRAHILIVGPTTPLSPVLFDYGAHVLSGSIVTDTEAVLRAVSQGANFRQIHRAGVHLVTVSEDQLVFNPRQEKLGRRIESDFIDMRR